jgi:hypothetical protein
MPTDDLGGETWTGKRSGCNGKADGITSAVSKWPEGYTGCHREQESGILPPSTGRGRGLLQVAQGVFGGGHGPD